MTFWQDYRWVILFYSSILILIFIFRKKFDIHHRFLAMYRTRIGLNLMDRLGTKHAETVKFLGYVGIGAGYIGLFVIVYYLLKNIINLLTVPTATSAVSLVVPGVKIPGSPITIPLITGWIALFIVILIHEFSHGVVARAHKIPVKSSGIFFLGPLMGAFVEPEEKHLRKSIDTTQYSVYAAGPFSNILLALACLLLLTYVFAPGLGAMENQVGVTIAGVTEGYPAAEAGMTAGLVVTAINDENIKNYDQFTTHLSRVAPNETVSITANGTAYTFVTAANPDNPGHGYLGVMASNKAATELKNSALWFKTLHVILQWIGELFAITGLLSFGIGLANLLPLGPVDGGRMVQVTLEKIRGAEKGNRMWRQISMATLLLLAINLFWPAIKWIGGLIA
ncbi:site-2 protease family protein [Candidatus Woesearchaeota archaeon]|nr:site-2 protease family protein [Candidatus Woesearchaeota archaeon]